MKRRLWIGTMGPFLYDDAKQDKGIIDEIGNYITNASINVNTASATVVTGVTFDGEGGGSVSTTTITYVTDVTLEIT